MPCVGGGHAEVHGCIAGPCSYVAGPCVVAASKDAGPLWAGHQDVALVNVPQVMRVCDMCASVPVPAV
jgi:hypothetical protein